MIYYNYIRYISIYICYTITSIAIAAVHGPRDDSNLSITKNSIAWNANKALDYVDYGNLNYTGFYTEVQLFQTPQYYFTVQKHGSSRKEIGIN